MKVRDRRAEDTIISNLIMLPPGILYWHVETIRINGTHFELGGSIQPKRALLVSDDPDSSVATIGSVE